MSFISTYGIPFVFLFTFLLTLVDVGLSVDINTTHLNVVNLKTSLSAYDANEPVRCNG